MNSLEVIDNSDTANFVSTDVLRELDLSRSEDLQAFLLSAEDIYSDTFKYFKVAEADKFALLTDDDISGNEIFETLEQKINFLQNLVEQCHVKLQNKEEIDDSKIDFMQRSYDDMILLRNYVYEIYVIEEIEETEEGGKTVIPIYVEPIVAKHDYYKSELDTKKEVENLAVFGLKMPCAGVAGIKTARLLREGLMMARDRHVELQKHPEKIMLVDKLVRSLANIPNHGLGETDLLEIEKLVRRINITRPLELKKVPSENVFKKSPEFVSINHSKKEDFGYFFPKSKMMEIVTDDEVIEIKISVPEEIEVQPKKISAEILEPEQTVIKKVVEKVEVPVTLKIEETIKENIPVNRPTIVHPKLVLVEHLSTKEYLNNDQKYSTFIKNYFGSPVTFEKMLAAEVLKIESESSDLLERWLKEDKVSPFSFLENMSVLEIEELSNRADLKNILAEKNIKYETFIEWMDLMPEMKSIVRVTPSMTFDELYTRWMIEDAIKFIEEEEIS